MSYVRSYIMSYIMSYEKVAIIRMYQSIFQQTEVNIEPTHRTLLAAKKYGLAKTIHQVVETGQIQIDWKNVY